MCMHAHPHIHTDTQMHTRTHTHMFALAITISLSGRSPVAGFRLPAGSAKAFLSDSLSKESLAAREIEGSSLFSS